MRFDTPIFLQRRTPGAYDAATGDYAPDTIIEDRYNASVTNSGADTLRLAYGEIRQGSLTVRLQNHILEPFDSIRIADKIYRVDMSRKLKNMQTLVISEVQGNA